MTRIATVIVATKSYLDQLEVCLRRTRAALQHEQSEFEHRLIMVTDRESESRVDEMTKHFDGKEIIAIDMEESGEHYKRDRQILIASLQSTGFDAARHWGCDYRWSVEADVLVPHNALSVSLDMLRFDGGYYDVSFVTYPSQGGGSFLGGYGSYRNPIAEDYLPEERVLPDKLKLLLDSCEQRLKDKDITREAAEKEHRRMGRIHEKIKKCPPSGNVFELNAKGWRRRG